MIHERCHFIRYNALLSKYNSYLNHENLKKKKVKLGILSIDNNRDQPLYLKITFKVNVIWCITVR